MVRALSVEGALRFSLDRMMWIHQVRVSLPGADEQPVSALP
ncbi:hypothetical protein [Streptomyces malaysiensis]|nr:hypothetical protein [Streptomyces sp. DR7-3]MCQ6251919.1 hypothetical protein [Streptomyces malaysiensis]